MNRFADPTWVVPNLIQSRALTAIVDAPNGGKTTILMHLSAETSHRYDVRYFNADVSGHHAKAMQEHADEAGYRLLLPDIAEGGPPMADVVCNLERTAAEDSARLRQPGRRCVHVCGSTPI